METVKHNNELIAKFQYPNFVHPKNHTQDWEKSNVTPILETCNGSYSAMANMLMEDFEHLNYHKSYDALIPVVKQIQTSVNIDKHKESSGWYAYYAMESLLPYAEIETVYEEVVKYILWYNENIKNNNCR